VVVSKQVKDAVNQQPYDLVIEVPACVTRLSRSGFDSDHYIAEQPPSELCMGALEK